MERHEYLMLCQSASKKIGLALPATSELVNYNGAKYIPYGYEMTFKNGTPKHAAVLKDQNVSSLVYAPLESVTKEIGRG